MHEEEVGDLLEVIGEVDFTGYCGSYPAYDQWEKSIATPALVAKGFTVLRWWTADGDSCGPLVRAVTVVKDGEKRILSYG